MLFPSRLPKTLQKVVHDILKAAHACASDAAHGFAAGFGIIDALNAFVDGRVARYLSPLLDLARALIEFLFGSFFFAAKLTHAYASGAAGVAHVGPSADGRASENKDQKKREDFFHDETPGISVGLEEADITKIGAFLGATVIAEDVDGFVVDQGSV